MTAHVWLEGAHHDFEGLREWYAEFLRAEGLGVRVGSLDDVLSGNPDLLVLGGLVYSGQEGYQPLPETHFARLRSLRRDGVPLLATHCVIGSFDERPEFDEFFDGRWVWDQSTHSPVEEFPVVAHPDAHPVARGLHDFVTRDELYYKLRNPRRSTVVLSATYAGQQWPLAWVGPDAEPPYLYLGLGHDVPALDREPVRQVLRASLRHLLQQSTN